MDGLTRCMQHRHLNRGDAWKPGPQHENDGGGPAMIAPADSPRKPRHVHHHQARAAGAPHPDESDATTEYSSWYIDDGSSRLSSPSLSYRSSRGDDSSQPSLSPPCPRTVSRRLSCSSLAGAALVPERDAGRGFRRDMSLSSAYFSAVDDTDAWEEFHLETHPFVGGPAGETNAISGRREMFHFELHPLVVVSRVEPRRTRISESWPTLTTSTSPTTATGSKMLSSLSESDDYIELIERTRHMLRREAQNEICDHFHHGELPLPGAGPGDSYSPVDPSCRSKMMDWSLRVVGYSFPRSTPDLAGPSQGQGTSPRDHSIETLQIVSQAFGLVDRLASLHFRRHGGRPMDRGEYKLTCMASLHLVAKTCGLYRLHDEEEGVEEEERAPIQRTVTRDESGTGVSSLCPSPMGTATPTLGCEGQTIVPTPAVSPDDKPGAATIDGNDNTCRSIPAVSTPRRRRPPLDLLSFAGLSALCQGECSPAQLAHAEWAALERLEWRLAGVTTFDWHSILMELLSLCNEVDVSEAGCSNQRGKYMFTDQVWERSITYLEKTMGTNRMVQPSLMAWAALTYALEECHARSGRETWRQISTFREVVQSVVLPLYMEQEVDSVRLEFLTP